MKIKQLFLMGLVFATTSTFAQKPCATPAPTKQQLLKYSQWVAQRKTLQKSSTGIQYIPIRFHVIRRSDGTGGATLADLNQALMMLNNVYAPAGISFFMSGATPNYINTSTYFDFSAANEDALCNANDVTNAVNVYLPNSVNYYGSTVGGYAYFPDWNTLSNRIFVNAPKVAANTMSHELGHYFNLYHTFENITSSDITQRELVIRPGDAQNGRPYAPNCTTTGDLLCDTPADPYGLSGASTSGCTYTGTITDANANLYTPQMSNIMSYYISCANVFTTGQYARIQEGLLLRTDPANQYTMSGAAQPTTIPANVQLSQTSLGVRVQFTYATTDAAGFLIERSTNPAGPFQTVGALAYSSANAGSYAFSDGSAAAYTTYYYRIKASNATTAYSTAPAITTGLLYCIPPYKYSGGATALGKIDDFLVAGTTLQNVATGLPANRYSDYTATTYTVNAGQTYTFTARAITGGFGTYQSQHLSIWIDTNRDGNLTDNERVFTGTQAMNPTLMGTFTVPASLSSGPVRMRIRSQNSADGQVLSACDQYNYGETEDYTLQVQAPILVRMKVLLEGYLNTSTGLMATALLTNNILPKQQPFNTSPWFYTGTEQVSTFPANVSDWVLLIARTTTGTVLARKPAFLRNDGTLIDLDGTDGVRFTGLSGDVYVSIHHKSHLAVMTNSPVTSGQLVDFTTSSSVARGVQQEKLVGSWYAFYAGDYDGSGIVNAADFSKWSANAAAVMQYLSIDSDGNGIVNAADFSLWTINSSKVGTNEIRN